MNPDAPVAVITGASRGIGRAIATRLVADGYRVVITARGQSSLADVAAELGKSCVAVAGKSDDPLHQVRALDAAVDSFGRLDVLVNNAGINPVFGEVAKVSPEAAAKVMGVNVYAAARWATLATERGLGAAPGASIVNIASVAGLGVAPGIGWYGVSKAALIQLTAQLAAELAPSIRVNAVAPAVVKTQFAQPLYAGREEEVAKGYALGRLGTPEDIAGVVAFLVGPDAAWVTGQTIVVDGGLGLSGGLA